MASYWAAISGCVARRKGRASCTVLKRVGIRTGCDSDSHMDNFQAAGQAGQEGQPGWCADCASAGPPADLTLALLMAGSALQTGGSASSTNQPPIPRTAPDRMNMCTLMSGADVRQLSVLMKLTCCSQPLTVSGDHRLRLSW